MKPGAGDLAIVPGDVVEAILQRRQAQIMDTVTQTYLEHHRGSTINPPSQFLRFPESLSARIIALPAAIRGPEPIAGIKWIASYPENTQHGRQRASAVLVLNDYETGYPYACLEGSRISAARTAASAAVAAAALRPGDKSCRTAIFVGAGIIARSVLKFMVFDGWRFDRVYVHDTDPVARDAFVEHASDAHALMTQPVQELQSALAGADLVVFATTAVEPHVGPCNPFQAGAIILHLSLRDLSPEIMLSATNIVDDAEHCFTAATSLHLAALRRGDRDFVQGTLAQVLTGEARPSRNRAIIFSPFGLGILDLAVGQICLEAALQAGEAFTVPNFLGNQRRW
jgi:N-[(2S)-2-amino-2-carboxyethyl]-L-glutamate dehydrogenase